MDMSSARFFIGGNQTGFESRILENSLLELNRKIIYCTHIPA